MSRKQKLELTWVLVALLVSPLHLAAQAPPARDTLPYRDARRSPEVRAADLLKRMTLEEKFWQLFMIPGSLDDPAHDYSKGILGLQISADSTVPPARAARAHAERINTIQRHFVERTRLGIPIIPFDEALHGLMREGAITFPHAIAMAATWDSALVKLVWDAGVRTAADTRATIDSAVRIARAAEVAIVVAGIEEGEFRDRAFLKLQGHQEELIRAVAATGTPVVVVLVGGSAINMPWLDTVGAVLLAWYPGEEGGNAVADVLFGDHAPAGRLPLTFPMSEGQLPLTYDHKPTGRGDDYLDLTGQPLFPFGYGLSYTTFEYSDLRISPDSIGSTGTATVRATITNTGPRAGDEVVQLYVRDVLTTVAQPLIALKGFARVHLAPGERREATFTLSTEHLRLLNEAMEWTVEPGVFRVLVGASSRDIKLRGELVVRHSP